MKKKPTKRPVDKKRRQSESSDIHTKDMGAQPSGKNPPSEGGMDPDADARGWAPRPRKNVAKRDAGTGPAQTEGAKDRIRRDDGIK